MYKTEFIEELLEDKTIGAGNFFTKLQGLNVDQERIVIELDDEAVLPDGKKTSTLSIRDIKDWSCAVAAWYEKNDVDLKDPVGLYLEDSIDYFIHYLALNYIGATPVLINSNLSADIVAQFLDRVGVTMAVSCGEKKTHLELLIKALKLEYKIVDSADLELLLEMPEYHHEHDPYDTVLVAHTSGTTGIPKAVQFNHHGFFFGVGQQLKKQVGERVMSALPHSHASAISIVMSTLLRGALLKVQTKKGSLEILASIASFRADMFISFPKILVDLCRYDLDQYDLSSISYWLSTGDANHETHIRKLIAQGRHEHMGEEVEGSLFIDNLGSSEFGFAAFRNIHHPNSNNYDRKIGVPFSWVEVAVLDQKGNQKKPYEVGFLGVKSPTVTAGYWNNTLLTEKNRLAGFWLTGDLVYKNDQDVFFHVDRVTDVIYTVEGALYSCQTEELVLKSFPEVFDCSIFGVEDESGFQKAMISLEMIKEGVDQQQFLARINYMLANNDTPEISSIIFESSDNYLGATGKKLKRVLRDNAEAA